MSKDETNSIDRDKIVIFEKTEAQLEGFFEEIGNLSKKKPDDAINKFKLGFINQMLARANALLEESYRPFPDFTQFDTDSVLTTSDVVTMLSQYLRAMDQYRKDRTFVQRGNWFWIVFDSLKDESPRQAKRPKNFE